MIGIITRGCGGEAGGLTADRMGDSVGPGGVFSTATMRETISVVQMTGHVGVAYDATIEAALRSPGAETVVTDQADMQM